ncbi:MAG TPA: PQQ-binding-like beta-propeller repeat protein, partial [Pirellulales bacterium]
MDSWAAGEANELLACEARPNVNIGLVRHALGLPPFAGLTICWLGAFLASTGGDPCHAQILFGGPSARFELSDSIDVPEVDTAIKARLEQAAAFVADEQWDEAIEALLQVMEHDAGRVIEISQRRYASVRDYCHLRLAALPPEALRIYRTRVDAQAKRLYEEAIAARDPAGLRRVVRQFFCSSSGDDALLALGETSLEAADHGAARGCWETLIETPFRSAPRETFEKVLKAEGVSDADRERLMHWYQPDSAAPPADYNLRADLPLDDVTRLALVDFWNARGMPSVRLAYPRSDIPLAEIRARLVLVSILEGSAERARGELTAFQSLHKGARGRLGGKEVDLADALASLLEKSKAWPPTLPEKGWPTFGGAFTREKITAAAPIPNQLLWPPVALPKTPATESVYPSPRVAETKTDLLSYHPVVVGNLVLVNTLQKIFAYDLRTGKPAWGADPAVYRPEEPGRETLHGASGTIGTARFTMTEHNGRLYARMGDPLTGRVEDQRLGAETSYLVCLDLASEGRLVWQTSKLEDKWAFEGSPIVEGGRLYVALRHGARPQAHVGCYDARTGRPLWRQFVVSAESPARGQVGECTHNLLTL